MSTTRVYIRLFRYIERNKQKPLVDIQKQAGPISFAKKKSNISVTNKTNENHRWTFRNRLWPCILDATYIFHNLQNERVFVRHIKTGSIYYLLQNFEHLVGVI